MKAQELSRKYATAVFSQALEKWLIALNSVKEKLADTPTLAQELGDAGRSFEERKQALNAVLPADSDQFMKNFFYLMLKEGDLDILPDVIAELNWMAKGGPQVQVARVTTAIELADAEKEQFRQKLRQKYGEGLEFQFNIDPSIVGGVVVQVGDKIIDGSVATRLESMSNLLGVAN